MSHILAIDQGTTSSRAMIFAPDQSVIVRAQQEFPQIFPRSGWVEHDPEAIWSSTEATIRRAIADAGLGPADIAAIGITNQRETTVLWDRDSGRPLANAIVWQDRRTADRCAALRADGHEEMIRARTGLLLDPYFSATKIAWLLDHVEGARAMAREGRVAFGTVDSFLIWRLTGGRVHATDATNAARTMLYDIVEGRWDDDILSLLDIPRAILPEVRDCADDFGTTGLFGGAIPIRGVAGDQQAATMGQACFSPGMVKSTYGTGCFALVNTGDRLIRSENRLLGTIAYRLGGRTVYALEGSIFIAGAVVQWLRDGLGVIGAAAETGPLAMRADPHQDVIMVPAFTGLGAPYWDSEARGAIFGLTRATGPAELARAALESVGFQTRDLIEAMAADMGGAPIPALRVDGGMTASDWTMQFLADILGTPVDRPRMAETTALGAAWLAGMAAGVWPDAAGFADLWALDRQFRPERDDNWRNDRHAAWRDAVRRTLSRPDP